MRHVVMCLPGTVICCSVCVPGCVVCATYSVCLDGKTHACTNALHFDPCSMDYDVFGLLSHKGYLKGEHMAVT